MPAIPNIGPAAFGVPAQPTRSRYGRAIIGMYSDLQDCWPCDDAATAASLRNLVSGGVALDTFAVASTVFPGRPSLLGNDPRGKSVQLINGSAYHAAAYTMPATGTLELLCSTVGFNQGSDAAVFGNWNGSGIAWLSTSTPQIKIYKDALNAACAFVAADLTPTQHWALTWDGSTQRWYINGIQRLTQAVGSPAAGGFIGLGVYSSANHSVSGRFQWLAVYKRALSAGEVLSHANLVSQPS